jgi:hypothetical protein
MHELMLMIVDDEIIVRWPRSTYSVTFRKCEGSPELRATHVPAKSDPRIRITVSQFPAHASRLANKKARELGWIT